MAAGRSGGAHGGSPRRMGCVEGEETEASATTPPVVAELPTPPPSLPPTPPPGSPSASLPRRALACGTVLESEAIDRTSADRASLRKPSAVCLGSTAGTRRGKPSSSTFIFIDSVLQPPCIGEESLLIKHRSLPTLGATSPVLQVRRVDAADVDSGDGAGDGEGSRKGVQIGLDSGCLPAAKLAKSAPLPNCRNSRSLLEPLPTTPTPSSGSRFRGPTAKDSREGDVWLVPSFVTDEHIRMAKAAALWGHKAPWRRKPSSQVVELAGLASSTEAALTLPVEAMEPRPAKGLGLAKAQASGTGDFGQRTAAESRRGKESKEPSGSGAGARRNTRLVPPPKAAEVMRGVSKSTASVRRSSKESSSDTIRRPSHGMPSRRGSKAVLPDMQAKPGSPVKVLRKTDLLKLARELSIPFPVCKRASDLFKDAVEAPKEAGPDFDHIKDARLTSSQFEEVFGEPPPDQNKDGLVDFKEFAFWFYSRGFSEDMVLSKEARETRHLARKLNIPILDAENYKRVFETFDDDNSGNIDYQEFVKVIHKLTRIPQGHSLPASRLQQLWRQADIDGSGTIDFEEFVTFYRKYFDHDSPDPIEDYYSKLSSRNLG